MDVEGEDLLNTSGGRSSRQSRAELKEEKKVEKEKQLTVLVENDVFEEKFEVEEIVEKREFY